MASLRERERMATVAAEINSVGLMLRSKNISEA
jgi:hypothetical protein